MAGMAAIVIDLGRQMAVKEQVQTAVDAGSLAGSMHGVRYVKVLVPNRWKRECDVCCCGQDECSPCCCGCRREELPDAIVEGTRKYVWDQRGWYKEAGCGSCGRCCFVYCGQPQVVEQWVRFPGDTNIVAREVTEINLPQDMSPEEGGGVEYIRPEVHAGVAEKQSGYASHYDPLAPSVIVRAKGWIKSLLAGGLFGVNRQDVGACGQSGVFFFKLSERGEQTGRMNPKPQPG